MLGVVDNWFDALCMCLACAGWSAKLAQALEGCSVREEAVKVAAGARPQLLPLHAQRALCLAQYLQGTGPCLLRNVQACLAVRLLGTTTKQNTS